MSRYIDAEFEIDHYTSMTTHPTPDVSEKDKRDSLIILEALRRAKSIDIVHCRECKKAHLTADGACKYCEEWKDDDGNYIEVYHDGDHFCSDGERNSSEEPNNCETCKWEIYCPEMCEGCCEWDSHYEPKDGP